MLLGIRKTTDFKPARHVQFCLPGEVKMSRQQNLMKSILKTQNQIQLLPAHKSSINGHVINLDEDSQENLPSKLCIHISDRQDELVVHIRNFHNGLPTAKGVAYDHSGWKKLMELLPVLDPFVKGIHGIPKVLFAFDTERSITVLNGGQPNVQIIFQREAQHVVLSRSQWLALISQEKYIRIKIMDHMATVIARVEAQM